MALKLKCPTCDVRMDEDDGTFVCPRCGHAVTVEKTFYEHVKRAVVQLKATFGGLPLKEVRSKVVDERDPLTLGIIGILAFFVARRLPMKIIISILLTLMAWVGPWGLLIASVIPLVWKLHGATIKKKAREIREDRGDHDFEDLDED